MVSNYWYNVTQLQSHIRKMKRDQTEKLSMSLIEFFVLNSLRVIIIYTHSYLNLFGSRDDIENEDFLYNRV